ncbi:MAG: PFL_4695 family integrating conjugative element protein [Hydrogenophaga sp.]
MKFRQLRTSIPALCVALSLAWAWTPMAAWAGLVVIAEAGPSVPVTPYLGHLLAGRDQPGVLPGVKFPLSSQLQADPVAAARDTAARTAAVFNPAWMVQPIFVLGTDTPSREWLQRHRHSLLSQGATGVVVQAGSEREFKAMQSMVPELTLIPAVGPWLEKTLMAAGVSHYPLWVDTRGVVHSAPDMAAGTASFSTLDSQVEVKP